MLTPKPCGPLSEAVSDHLHGTALLTGATPSPADDHDLHLTLWTLYELAYRGFDDVPDDAEWDPDLLRVRRDLETTFEAELRDRCGDDPGGDLAEALFTLAESHEGPSLARHVQRDATREQVLELLRVRSVYHLKEADPTSWVIPRLEPGPKAALVELQYDEYGGGNPERLHHALFAQGLAGCGLDASYGAYVEEAPTEALAQNNAMSLFGLHRRLRGAALGHLAVFEATSSGPSRRMARGLQRLGLSEHLIDYYTEHVEADAVHEQLATRAICAPLVEADPRLREDVLLGAWTCLTLEDRLAERLLADWDVRAAAA